MFNYISEKYQKIIHLNFLWAFFSFICNFYLYPKLPTIVPIHFRWNGISNDLGGRFIIWVFPLIFIVFHVAFNEKHSSVFSHY
ncbi:DUF1648 domain-containing protein [Melissococcus plutonius]|uniref:DUF1648 domain-containing protein n=1 Tax=Melissococcus plutonius TaxID=33970 RepID=UPI003C2E3930